MPGELHTFSQQNLPDVVRTLNESSRSTSLNYNLDTTSFPSLWRYWNFSSTYSLLLYVEHEPAAVVIHSVDPLSRQAFAFYWGAIPRFREQGLARFLFEASCKKMADDQYTLLYADSLPERPAERYRSLHFQPNRVVVNLRADHPPSIPAEARFEIRSMPEASISNLVLPPDESLHWTQRPEFLRNIASYLQFVGAFEDDCLKAYAVVAPRASQTTILDFRSPGSCRPAGLQLLRHLAELAPVPISASYVSEPSYTYNLLTESGFVVTHRFSVLQLDLCPTSR